MWSDQRHNERGSPGVPTDAKHHANDLYPYYLEAGKRWKPSWNVGSESVEAKRLVAPSKLAKV
jgi:hypothetical protein